MTQIMKVENDKDKEDKGPVADTSKDSAGSNKDKKDMRVILVKKNLIDQTAALSYSMGVSIVHLALLVTIQFVGKVDFARLNELTMPNPTLG